MADEHPQVLDSIPLGSLAHHQLIKAMKVVRQHATTESEERLYDDVLSGKRSARELLSSSHFNELAMTGFKQYEKARAEMSEEERSTLDARAAQAAETLTDPETPERNS